MVAFHKGLAKPKVSKKRFFELWPVWAFSAQRVEHSKPKTRLLTQDLINFQNASRSVNPSLFDNFLDPFKFSLHAYVEPDIFSKPSDWANFWNSNRCDVRIDIFERILDVHQEFCDVQSRQILTIKLKNLEYRQFSMWQKWWKILMYINFSSKYVDADNISLWIPKISSNGWFREDIGFHIGPQRKFQGVKKIVEYCDYSWISNLHQQHLATLKCSSLRCEKHLGLKKGKIRYIWWISVKLADLATSTLDICFKFDHM